MATSLTTIATDRRHIDPNPDRLALFSSGSLPTPQPLSSTSLLLLSTSAEAAVLESRRFERGSRHSSLSASLGSPPPPPLPPTPPQTLPAQASPAASKPQHSPLRRHSNHHHNLHHHRLHHRFAEAVALQPPAPNHSAQHPPATASNGGTITKRDGAKNGHLFKCEKCLKVYRHPQCLVKHRWEHTSYWADASKLMLSKHQQVQMLEAAAILAAPSGSLPESRSLWPAAVSPSEAGLLGSDRVNLDVIQSQQARMRVRAPGAGGGHQHSSSVPCARLGGRTGEVDEERGRRSEAGSEEDIMFEMSLDGDDGPPRARTQLAAPVPAPAPPPMGYFSRRTAVPPSRPQPHGQPVARVPALVAYQPFVRTEGGPVGMVYHPETIFKPPRPYADSELRFEGRTEVGPGPEPEAMEEDEEATEDEEEEERWSGSLGGRDREGDELVGMEL